MLTYLLNKQESNLVSLSKKDNKEELLGWKIPNVLFPLTVIVFSLIAYWGFTPNEKFDGITFFNLLVNGSILIAAFNRMSSLITYYSKIEFVDSKKLKINLRNIKMKIFGYIIFLVLAIASVYSYQVINRPFDEVHTIFIQFTLSGLFFWFSIDATKVTFLLQDAFLNNTYELNFRTQMQSVTQTPTSDEIQY